MSKTGQKKAAHLRALRENTLAFIKKHGGIEGATNAILSSPSRSQHWADIRETTVQGVALPDEGAMELFSDNTSVDIEWIAMEETEPELG